jgi:hypothetical protein
MRPLSLAVGMLALAALAACASGRYVHPTKPASDLAVDQAECEQKAAELFPPLYKSTEVGDQNASNRSGSTSRCLFERGWRWQTGAQ